MPKIWRDIIVTNKVGLHARPAMAFVDIANQYHSKVTVSRQNPTYEVDGKSVMEMITLEATEGTGLRITADGEDAEPAVAALAKLFEDKFGEE